MKSPPQATALAPNERVRRAVLPPDGWLVAADRVVDAVGGARQVFPRQDGGLNLCRYGFWLVNNV